LVAHTFGLHTDFSTAPRLIGEAVSLRCPSARLSAAGHIAARHAVREVVHHDPLRTRGLVITIHDRQRITRFEPLKDVDRIRNLVALTHTRVMRTTPSKIHPLLHHLVPSIQQFFPASDVGTRTPQVVVVGLYDHATPPT
jgi:hypothetical protein